MACAQVEVETGWQVDDPHDPTSMTASAAHGLTQLMCVSPPVSKHVSAVARRTTDRAATTHDTWAPRVHDAGHPPTVTRENSLRRITRLTLIQPNWPHMWSHEDDPANFNQELSEARSRVFLIDPKSGCVVGFACSSENTVDGEHGDSVIVDMVVTSSEFYGFGLGRFMVKTLLETCHPNRSATVGNLNRRVSTAVFAKVDMGHAAAKGLWQSLGLQRQCKTNGASNFMCGMFSEADLEKNVQWWSGWAQETIDDYGSRKGARHNVKQRRLVHSMQSLHPNSRMADYSTFVECGDVAFYPPGATDEKHLQAWREYDNLHRGRADDPTDFGYWLVGGAGNELLTSGPHQGFIGSAEHVVHLG